MADVGELLRDAQYAFQNISHGQSAENRKNSARAKSLARKIIRKNPTSSEAGQAQLILERLDPDSATHSIRIEPEHQFDQKDRHEQLEQHHRPLDIDRSSGGDEQPVNRDWKKLLLRLTQIHSTTRNIILLATFLLVALVPFAAFVIIATVIFLAGPFKEYHPQGTQENLNKLYDRLDAWTSNP